MWELDHKEGWAPKNWCFELWYWRRLWRAPWTVRRSNQSIVKEINSEYSLEGLDAEAEAPVLWLSNGKSQFIDEMVGWHHWLNGHICEQILGDGEGQRNLACCNSWIGKSLTWLSDWTRHTLYRNTLFIHNSLLNIYTHLNHIYFYFLHYLDFVILIYFWIYQDDLLLAFAITLNNDKNGLTYIHNYI